MYILALVNGTMNDKRCLYKSTDVFRLDSFVVIKLIMGMNLLSYAAHRRVEMEARAAADVVNEFGRDPIGEGKEEQVCSSLSPLTFPLYLC